MTEPAGISRYKFPVLLRIPQYHVEARSTQRLRLIDASGDEIPAQANVVRSSDSVLAERSMWLEVHFHCSLEPFETRTFMADWVTAALMPPPPLELNGMRLTVEESTESAGCFTVRNGDAISWRVPLYFGSGISSVLVPPTEYVRQQEQGSDASALRLTYRWVASHFNSLKWIRCDYIVMLA